MLVVSNAHYKSAFRVEGIYFFMKREVDKFFSAHILHSINEYTK